MVFELFIHYTFDTTIEIVTLECISRCYQTLTILANLLLVTDTQNPESQQMEVREMDEIIKILSFYLKTFFFLSLILFY